MYRLQCTVKDLCTLHRLLMYIFPKSLSCISYPVYTIHVLLPFQEGAYFENPEKEDPTVYTSEKTGRGPLETDWIVDTWAGMVTIKAKPIVLQM